MSGRASRNSRASRVQSTLEQPTDAITMAGEPSQVQQQGRLTVPGRAQFTTDRAEGGSLRRSRRFARPIRVPHALESSAPASRALPRSGAVERSSSPLLQVLPSQPLVTGAAARSGAQDNVVAESRDRIRPQAPSGDALAPHSRRTLTWDLMVNASDDEIFSIPSYDELVSSLHESMARDLGNANLPTWSSLPAVCTLNKQQAAEESCCITMESVESISEPVGLRSGDVVHFFDYDALKRSWLAPAIADPFMPSPGPCNPLTRQEVRPSELIRVVVTPGEEVPPAP